MPIRKVPAGDPVDCHDDVDCQDAIRALARLFPRNVERVIVIGPGHVRPVPV